jgi:hypothetical protein
MGTWSTGPFDNDDARDFLYEVEEEPTLVEAVLKAVQESEYVETPEGARAIAAARLVADARKGTEHDTTDETVAAALKSFKAAVPNIDILVPFARAAIERVVAPKSEVEELWNEHVVDPADRDAWKASLTEIMAALA